LLFLFFLVSGPALGPNQSVVDWVQVAVSPGVRRQSCEADHIHAEAENSGAMVLQLILRSLPLCLDVLFCAVPSQKHLELLDGCFMVMGLALMLLIYSKTE
jgi:hypothetical protein